MTLGAFITCLVLLTFKQKTRRNSLAWAILSIAYTATFHIGIALLLFDLLWR